MSTSFHSRRFGVVVSVVVSVAALGVAACSGKSSSPRGTGGSGGSSAGAGGSSGGAGGKAGSGGTTGGSAGSGTGGATGGSSGSGGATGGSSGTSAGQGGSSSGSGGAAGSGAAAGEGGEGGGMQDDRPVLERPVREELACAVTTAMKNLMFEWAEGDLAETPDGVFLLWGRPAASSMPDSVELASIDETGTLGASTPIATYMGAYSSRPRLAASSRGMTAAWAEAGANEMSEMRIAELDAMGAVSKAPVTVPGLSERLGDPAVVSTATGNALLFVNTTVDYTTHRVRFARLDMSSAIVGDVVDLDTQMGGAAPTAGELVAVPGGFAATFTRWGTEAESFLAFLGADGAVQGDPIVLGSARPNLGQSLLVRGDELIVAYGDDDGGYENADIGGFIGLARFDLASRTLAAPVVRVQTPTVGDETVNPVLFTVDDNVGVLWSRGTVIYVCAGCMPDNHLEAVIMDGDDFTPVSTLLTLPNNQPMGGFIRPGVAPVGEHFVVTASLRFHVSGAAASGAFRCTPAP